jgi:hypothetical protein
MLNMLINNTTRYNKCIRIIKINQLKKGKNQIIKTMMTKGHNVNYNNTNAKTLKPYHSVY